MLMTCEPQIKEIGDLISGTDILLVWYWSAKLISLGSAPYSRDVRINPVSG